MFVSRRLAVHQLYNPTSVTSLKQPLTLGWQARSRGDIKAPFIAVLRADKRTQQPMVAVTMMGGGSGAGGGSKKGFTGKPDAIKTAADTAGERSART